MWRDISIRRRREIAVRIEGDLYRRGWCRASPFRQLRPGPRKVESNPLAGIVSAWPERQRRGCRLQRQRADPLSRERTGSAARCRIRQNKRKITTETQRHRDKSERKTATER